MAPLPTQPVKKALSISLTYKHRSGEIDELPMAHRDSATITHLLENVYAYRPENIRVMTDAEDTPDSEWPSQENILRAMEALVEDAQPGDHFVFHFSGHGSQVKNWDGTEEDGQDEVIWPADIADTDKVGEEPTNYIKDDVIKEILVDRIPPGAHLTLILDCCHSGTAADLPNCYSGDWDAPDSPLQSPSSPMSPRAQLPNGKLSFKKTARIGNPNDYDVPGTAFANSDFSWPYMEDSAYTHPEVICLSACPDPLLAGESSKGGFFVTQLAAHLRKNPHVTYKSLINLIGHRMDRILDAARRGRAESGSDDGTSSSDDSLDSYGKPQLSSLCPTSHVLYSIVRL